ncbi:MAG TPA: dephospho-CoA kinase [Candidatus Obscuribacterales bacterium]
MPRLIGITGTIGSGKSTVGRLLTEAGVPVIDTDAIVHELLEGDREVQTAVLERFGPAVLLPGAKPVIDRAKLGRLVFQDESARKDLERIVHPAVIQQFRKKARDLCGHAVVAVLVPLLFEAGISQEFDQVWTVVTDEATLRQRLKQRDHMTDGEIDSRLGAQWPQDEKARRSHRVIDNSGTVSQTRRQVEEFLAALTGKH